MKLFRLCLICTLTSMVMTGCFMNKTSTCFPGQRCNEYQIYNRCGSSLKYECEDICRQCKAYEPSCYSCSACIESSPEACIGSTKHGGRCGN